MYDLAPVYIYTNIFIIISNRFTISHQCGSRELTIPIPPIGDRANSVPSPSQSSRRSNGVDKTSLIDEAGNQS
jgi:hypothetical protein